METMGNEALIRLLEHWDRAKGSAKKKPRTSAMRGFCFKSILLYFVSSISGKPSLPAPMTTTFALVELASFSVASMPFHLSS